VTARREGDVELGKQIRKWRVRGRGRGKGQKKRENLREKAKGGGWVRESEGRGERREKRESLREGGRARARLLLMLLLYIQGRSSSPNLLHRQSTLVLPEKFSQSARYGWAVGDMFECQR
jgi:hypothetical protein